MTLTRRDFAGCEHCFFSEYISSATAPGYDNTVKTGYTDPEPPVSSLFAVCQALSAECAPGCLLNRQSGIYSHNAACACDCRANVRALVWFRDNSSCMCFCIIVVL